MKSVLITGATGFIGSHLCELMIKKNFKVVAFDRYNPNYNLGNLENSKFKKDINFVFGDIRDYDSVNKATKNVDAVIHLAALIGIPYSYFSPMAYIRTNVEGSYNVLESARNNNVGQIIITSTSEVYGSAQYLPMDEKHPLVSQSPYAASKIAADQLSLSYFRSFKTPVKIIRPFNTFGPRQSSRAVIPTIINQCLNEKQIRLGNIKPKRDYLYVEDTARAYLEILKNKKFFGKVVNVGSGYDFSIKEITQYVQTIIGTNKKIVTDKKRVRNQNSEVDHLRCDNSFLRKNSKWKKGNNFYDDLTKTINWFKKSKNKTNSKNIYYLMKRNINVGIIGAGNIASKHLEVIKNIKNFKIKAITSRTLSKAKKLAKTFKIEKINESIEDLLKKSYRLPPHFVSAENMYSTIKKIINFKVPFFFEKPAGLNYRETKELSDLCYQNKIKNMVGLNRRFYSIFEEGKKIIKKRGGLKES